MRDYAGGDSAHPDEAPAPPRTMRRLLRRRIVEDERGGASASGGETPGQPPLSYAPPSSTLGGASSDSAPCARNGDPAPDPASESRLSRSPQALTGLTMPSLLFNNFDRRFLDLGELARGSLVLYLYPGCERSPSDGSQSLSADALQHRTYSAMRDRFAEVIPQGALVAVSSISPTQQFNHAPQLAWDQDEGAPFPHYLVSDEMLQLARELGAPTFEHEDRTFYQRLTLIARGGRIQRVFHPVKAGQDARQALTWLQLN